MKRFKPWVYEGFTFDDSICAYFKDDENGAPAYSIRYMANHNIHLKRQCREGYKK